MDKKIIAFKTGKRLIAKMYTENIPNVKDVVLMHSSNKRYIVIEVQYNEKEEVFEAYMRKLKSDYGLSGRDITIDFEK
jgi:hypothetical protein